MVRIVAIPWLSCVGWLALCRFVSPVAASESAGVAPRYRFRVGHELIYKQTSTEDVLASDDEQDDLYRYESTVEWRVYVTRQNDDGRWRLFIRKHYEDLRIPNPDAPVDWKSLIVRSAVKRQLILPGQTEVTFDNDFLACCDLRPDGRYEMNSLLGDNVAFKVQPEELFLQLPDDAKALAEGWEFDGPASGSHFALHGRLVEDGRLEISGSESTSLDDNYEMTQTRKVRFDLERGLPEKIVSESKSTRKARPWHTRTTVKLVDFVSHDAEWTDKFVAEAEAHLDMSRQWWKSFEAASTARTAAECKATLDEVRSKMVALRDRADVPDIREIYESRLRLHDRDSASSIDEAANREALYAKPPADWETEDFNEQPQRLVDYRGKILVMDFWYRGCYHCIKALPKVKKIHAKYKDEPVVVLGVNNDQAEEDAKFVIEKYSLKYPCVKDRDISKLYNVHGWPTFVVLDQSGRVALHVCGNAEDLVDQISRTVDALLTKPASVENAVEAGLDSGASKSN
jgi:thiol-disulfide isomerase/thioredoxin